MRRTCKQWSLIKGKGRERVFSLVVVLALSLCLIGCGSPQYQLEMSKKGQTVALAITPYPQKSLIPTYYTCKVTRDGQPVQQPVEVEFTMPDMEMNTDIKQAQPKGEGLYTFENTLSMPGKWNIFVRTGEEEFVFEIEAPAGQEASDA